MKRRIEDMVATVQPVRDKQVVWRDIAGEVVIAERDGRTVHVLNKTASLIWTLADGTRHTEDIVAEVCNKFEVAPEQARLDVSEFCQQLLEVGLISFTEISKKE
jgi:hypothetical protein